MNLSRIAVVVAFTLPLVGCANEVLPTSPEGPPGPDAVAVAPAINARVDGETILFLSLPEESRFSLWGPDQNRVDIIGIRMGANGPVQMQIALWNFDGVGAYVLDGDSDVSRRGGWGIYDRDTLPAFSYWSAGLPGDTAWVDAFDPVSGDIEGRFSFRGHPISDAPAAPSIEVTRGEFRGTLRVVFP